MSWFNQLFGFAEKTGSRADFLQTKEEFELNGTSLKSKGNDRVFEAGLFTTPSLRELKADVNLAEARRKLPGSLKVQEVVGDVSALHTAPENKYSLFQAASQFNCLEFVSERVVPERGIACYASDPTQGPACATACAPGTVVRNYFGLDGEGQSANRQIECLKDIEGMLDNENNGYFRVVGGYTMANDASLAKLNKVIETQNAEVKEEFRNFLRIGVQWDTEVTGSKFGRVQYRGPQQLVTQAYCSACSVSYSSGSTKSWSTFATLILEASYEATMYAALQNALRHEGAEGSKRIFLTCIGGGVFGNEMSWIVHAIERALRPFKDLDLEVNIVSFGRREAGLRRLLREYGEE